MFKIESYVTPILLSYVDKYVRDFKPADAQVSLWGGGVALHNLVIKADVLQQEVALPFTLVSGRIHELLIQVPWTKIMSEPIVVTIDTIECVLSLNPPVPSSDDNSGSDSSSRKTTVMEAPPGYMQALVRRIVSNIALRVHHLIVKYVQDDIVMSLNVKHLAVDSAGQNWEPSFADIDQAQPVIRRLMRLDDLTLCLDRSDSDGKIRFYQEPLLYRCQLDFRILTRLVSANTRRATSLSIQLRSSKLAWGVTVDQLTLLLRLVGERVTVAAKQPAPPPKTTDTQTAPITTQSSASAEPARSGSWSSWAWSWLPSWADRDLGPEDTPEPPAPVTLHFAAYFDHVCFVFKIMESEGSSRKRTRGVLELNASKMAFKCVFCKPTMMIVRAGARTLSLLSRGKCVCGHLDYNALQDEPTYYLRRPETDDSENEWEWPEDHLGQVIETAQEATEENKSTTKTTLVQGPSEQNVMLDPGQPEEPASVHETEEPKDDNDDFWMKMAPLFFVEFVHERSPPRININPYDNPPIDFQYSDWVEECSMKVVLRPLEARACAGLQHRLTALATACRDMPPVTGPDLPKRVLTVEECEYLTANIPQRRVTIEANGLKVCVRPWDHSLTERPMPAPLILDLDLPKITVIINGPLYPHRVCSAACQLPEETGPLWQGARLHITVNISLMQANIRSKTKARPCARADVTAVLHVLLNKHYFTKRESVILGCSLKIQEAHVCGSAARLQAAREAVSSLVEGRPSSLLVHSELAGDALNDEELVAIDLTFEDLIVRSFFTSNTSTIILTLQAAKATVLHEPKAGELKQAWIFSAPDSTTNTPYIRLALQWCVTTLSHSLEYAGLWTEPMAVAVDPLFIAWLAYKPKLKPIDIQMSSSSVKSVSSQYFVRRRNTLPSSSGRGGSRSGSGAEVHGRGRSVGSSDKADARGRRRGTQEARSLVQRLCESERLVPLHERLQKMLVNAEVGLTLVYVTSSSACALDCVTVRDAMERHASLDRDVLVLSLGRLTMFSSTLTKQFWNDIQHDGPTFVVPKTEQKGAKAPDSFPWKVRLADVSCYTLEVADGRPGAPRSQLRTAGVARPRTILELVTSTVTLSVVTKQLQIVQLPKKEPAKKEKPLTSDEARVKYFTKGMDFKPTTLKEFIRGPARRKKEKAPEPAAQPESEPVKMTSGPVVSLGIHLHADTPPLIIRLEHDQVHVVAQAVHCFTHIVALLKQPPLHVPRMSDRASPGGSRSLIRSVSEVEEMLTPSDTDSASQKSDLISIYEALSAKELRPINIKTFFWFQWVVNRVSLVATTSQVKLAFSIDDIISSVDLQTHYNQFKVKVASASVKHYMRIGSEEWTPGVLGGRVLEAREPANAKEENNFLGITVTQAQISNLPASWKEELHPKLLEHKRSTDCMWEIYATLAPLEAVLQPKILDHVMALVLEMAPRSFCPLAEEQTTSYSKLQWPFFYVTAGGLRLLLTVDDEIKKREDDTFVCLIGKVTMNPHPENPICRRPVNPVSESGWSSAGGLEGCQYELNIKNVAVRCARFSQLVDLEIHETKMQKGTAGENPALKWTQVTVIPVVTPVLHSLDLNCVMAPALYVNEVLMCGPAVELNLVSDCALELNLDQLVMVQKVIDNMSTTLRERKYVDISFDEEKLGVCPYASLLHSDVPEDFQTVSSTTFIEDNVKSMSNSTQGADSGVDSFTASTSAKQQGRFEEGPQGVKKSVSIAFVESWPDASEYLEVFVTMGTIEVSLYAVDDGSDEIVALRPPRTNTPPEDQEKLVQVVVKEEEQSPPRGVTEEPLAASSAKSLTDTVRDVDVGKTKLELRNNYPAARKNEGSLPLVHVTLNQPNFYYWRKKAQKTIQVSLFDAWAGLGAGEDTHSWHLPLLSTAKGVADPVTDIPPALATLKILVPSSASSQTSCSGGGRGSITLDVERPVMMHVSEDRLRRLRGIYHVTKNRLSKDSCARRQSASEDVPLLNKLKRVLASQGVESVSVCTTQVCVRGSRGAAGWARATGRVASAARGDRLAARVLLAAATAALGPAPDARHLLMQPLMIGVEVEASWEAWRRAEGGAAAREPSVRVGLELDGVTLDLRPEDLAPLEHIRHVLRRLQTVGTDDHPDSCGESSESSESSAPQAGPAADRRVSYTPEHDSEAHFYKDDLRSGAFKIVSGGQLPMAYQVTLHNNAVSWRYPHPRAITRLVVFPLPGQDEETPCVLELYCPQLGRWEPHTRFAVPVGEPREMQLYVPAPDAMFAVMWRFRVLEREENPPPFQFNINKYMPNSDPLVTEPVVEATLPAAACGVTPEQLSGVVRVDSCFSPRLAPRLRILTRIAHLNVFLHNALPPLSSQRSSLEGYYVSKPFRRAHRVLSVCARDCTLYAHLASPAGALLLYSGHLSSDVMECATGTMEPLVEELAARGALSVPAGGEPRARLTLARLHVALHVPRLRTLHALAADWQAALLLHVRKIPPEASDEEAANNHERDEAAMEALEGRVSLWIHNCCASALRVGQEGTDEVVPLGPGARLAYRWRNPTAPKCLRFALAGPAADWHWSTSIPFVVEHYRIRLPDAETVGSSKSSSGGAYLYTSVEERGSRRCMRLSGRLCLANMLRFNLLYKVRARWPESSQWRTVWSGELAGETVGRAVLCGADCEMSLKIRFSSNETGWSGDIPLKECPKENVPWLVKVPSEGEVPYMSVWTRVVRARSDGRILATVWPLYVLYSYLPLDTDVLIVTESNTYRPEGPAPAPAVQPAPGRGACTHLLAPGTTAARHYLSFQYRNIECPVTKEAVPLHYGVTITSVFDKRAPVTSLEAVFKDTLKWLERSARGAPSSWPYSIVTKHWPGQWKSAVLQPRCDVTVQYAAVCAGGGCSLEVRLSPRALLCNAAPTALTLRAHDAAPLCRLDPGTAISPPSAVLTKPFFISVEMGRETFVSGELSVSDGELGRYEEPPPGRVALDHPAEIAVQCNHKVALLTMYYEIKDDMNILGMTSTYTLLNRLNCDILVSAMAVPSDDDDDAVLRPSSLKVVEPTAEGNVVGTPLCKFFVAGHVWRGGDPRALRLFLCVCLTRGARPAPVRLARAPLRRALALTDRRGSSIPVVVIQMKHEGRWVVSVSPDPCPQLLVHNVTRDALAVAQAAHTQHEHTTTNVTAIRECAGARWFCVIEPDCVTHYSTPSHCLRYPPPASGSPQPAVTFLTFAKPTEDSEPDWCAPVATADGEQLLQLSSGRTVKMRVRTHPHSTHIELRDVDLNDISASDIRKRLIGAFSSETSASSNATNVSPVRTRLDRTAADNELLTQAEDRAELLRPESASTMVSVHPELGAQVHEIRNKTPSEGKPEVTTDNLQPLLAESKEANPSSCMLFSNAARESLVTQQMSVPALRPDSTDSADANFFNGVSDNEWESASERLRVVAAAVAVELAASPDVRPLVALHLDRAAVVVKSDARRTRTTISIANVQVDNLQHESGAFDFAVVAKTRGEQPASEPWPPLANMFGERRAFAARSQQARVMLRLTHDSWTLAHYEYTELAEVELRAGPISLYVEDAYVAALATLFRATSPPSRPPAPPLRAEERVLQAPLRLRTLTVHPLHLTLTLHTAVRMYIALDQSPLRLSAFKLHDAMTSAERLTHALTVHYLSAAILGAGWVVGGLELLGAPGALAARVGGAGGGVRGVASAAAAALLRSLSAWAGSLARNLDLLAGDDEHTQRAAAARRRPPHTLLAGLLQGVTNFAINILGAVGGLAHHPLVSVAVGETESGATALRRGLIGALAKPLSATADLVAYAGHGLLTQTGWDPVPQPRSSWVTLEAGQQGGWRRDCVRWTFRLADLPALAGFYVLLDGAPLQLLFTHKYLVVAAAESERIIEMIDFKFCTVGPYQGQIIELIVNQRRPTKVSETRPATDEDDEIQISAAAMDRVARYTGGGTPGGGGGGEAARALALLPAPGRALALHAALTAAAHHNSDAHVQLL